ncbi:uncharacterized protein LOC101861013 [Aplysia californica]|uniref:Uncharacterized protein LOC101861013 n=1 Tax=Aplysia californica TaxID=6500 RepID=A0ABM1A118_APLCA|nr:uncharacterized protein LOC101861013 [Aplysia californica]
MSSEKLFRCLISARPKTRLRDAELLLCCGADPNQILPTEGVTAMHIAAGQGQSLVSLMLQYGGDPNVLSEDHDTPLHVTASWGDVESMQLLLSNGADVTIPDQEGKTALDLAVEGGHKSCEAVLRYQHMLITVKDDVLSPKFTVETRTFNGNDRSLGRISMCGDQGDSACCLDSSTIDPDILSQEYTNAVTDRLYECLAEGQPVYFDATSPNTPVVGSKPFSCKMKCDEKTFRRHQHENGCKVQPQYSCGGFDATPLSCGLHHNGYGHSKSCSCPPFLDQCCNRSNRSPVSSNNSSVSHFHNHCSAAACRSNCNARTCFTTCNDSASSSSPKYFPLSSKSEGSLDCIIGPRQAHSSLARHKDSFQYCSQDVTEHCCNPPQHGHHAGCLSPSDRSCLPHSPYRQHTSPHGSPSAPFAYRSTKHSPSRMHGRMMQTSGLHSPCRELSSLLPNRNKHVASDVDYSRSSPSQSTKSKSSQPESGKQQEHLDVYFPHKTQDQESNILPVGKEGNFSRMQPCSYFPPLVSGASGIRSEYSDSVSNEKTVFLTQNSDLMVIPKSPSNAHSACFPKSSLSGRQPSMPESSSSSHSVSFLKSSSGGRPPSSPKSPSSNPSSSMLKSSSSDLPVPVSLPKSSSSSQERVAEFVLSTTDFLNKCSVEDSGEVPSYPSQLDNLEPYSLTDKQDKTSEGGLNVSGSSQDTYATCDNGLNDDTVKGLESTVNDRSAGGSSVRPQIVPETQGKCSEMTGENSLRWKPPPALFSDTDIMTSDESFIQRARSPRVYRMKKSRKENEPPIKTDQQSMKNKFAAEQSVQKSLAVTDILNSTVRQTNISRLSDESLFSTVSVREYVYKDPERGVTLIERHIPSECGSSIGRRSLDSVTSKGTVESQSTLIYDWRSIQKSHESRIRDPASEFQTHASKSARNENLIPECDRASQSSSTPWNHSSSSSGSGERSSDTAELSEAEDTPVIEPPAHLESLSNQEVSQRLQVFGEMPGPVIPATRQAYLRRLASLESNPGLVKICKTCPDFPCELRQALNGKFDSSGLEELEQKMVQAFSNTNGRHWREGTAKSSFTYLLLDPRVTENLPLRAKAMNEVEIFKTFICAIFYVGKGKRARPYCHLYEAVSKRAKEGKKSAKVQHILDIWESGLGAVSLHCFQSVIPVEAYTREACMLEAIGLHKVTNMKRGDFYGLASTWSMQQRRMMGVFLLQKALKIFLAEGERQICVPDLKGSQ